MRGARTFAGSRAAYTLVTDNGNVTSKISVESPSNTASVTYTSPTTSSLQRLGAVVNPPTDANLTTINVIDIGNRTAFSYRPILSGEALIALSVP